MQFNLKHLGAGQIETQLDKILEQEAIATEADCTRLIAGAADGSMRDALSLLDQAISYGNGRLEATQVRDMLGTIDGEELSALPYGYHRTGCRVHVRKDQQHGRTGSGL